MSLRFVDSFNHYQSADVPTKYSSRTLGFTGTVNIASGGRSSNNAMVITVASDANMKAFVTKNMAASLGSTVYFGVALKVTGAFVTSQATIEFGETGVGVQWRLLFNAGGQIILQRGTTTVLTTAQNLVLGQTNYIEVKAVIDPSAGVLEVRVNGVVWGTFTGNTRNLAVATMSYFTLGYQGNPGLSSVVTLNDLYLCDGAGSVNNTYLGDVRIVALLPNGAGATSDFAQTGGTGGQPYTAVADTTPDGDTSYLSSAAVPATHTLQFGDVSGSPVIKGVAVNLYARKDDAGGRTIQAVARPGSTDRLGSAIAPNTSYALTQDIWDQNPDTGAAWTASEVNAAQFGLKNAS